MTPFNVGVYLFSVTIGLVLGLLFSKIQYHKGKREAYEEMEHDIQQLIERYAKETHSFIENAKGE